MASASANVENNLDARPTHRAPRWRCVLAPRASRAGKTRPQAPEASQRRLARHCGEGCSGSARGLAGCSRRHRARFRDFQRWASRKRPRASSRSATWESQQETKRGEGAGGGQGLQPRWCPGLRRSGGGSHAGMGWTWAAQGSSQFSPESAGLAGSGGRLRQQQPQSGQA
jgi:hypothetical protein